MNDLNWKKALVSILIGALTAFLTSFLSGLIELIKTLPDPATGGITASLIYALRRG